MMSHLRETFTRQLVDIGNSRFFRRGTGNGRTTLLRAGSRPFLADLFCGNPLVHAIATRQIIAELALTKAGLATVLGSVCPGIKTGSSMGDIAEGLIA